MLFALAGKYAISVLRERAAIQALRDADVTFETMNASIGFSMEWEEVDPLEDYDPLFSSLSGERPSSPSRATLRSQAVEDRDANAALMALRLFPETQYVYLAGPAFNDDSMAHFAELPHLKSVGLSDTNVTHAGILKLSSTLVIHEITIDNSRTPSALMNGIASLPELESLYLFDNVPVQANAYSQLRHADRLKLLVIIRSDISDDDMAHIADMDGLEQLTVDGISDIGLFHLGSMDGLQLLKVFSPVTKEAAMQFSSANPACRVVYVDARGDKLYYVAGKVDP